MLKNCQIAQILLVQNLGVSIAVINTCLSSFYSLQNCCCFQLIIGILSCFDCPIYLENKRQIVKALL